jgi:hypothetical protein
MASDSKKNDHGDIQLVDLKVSEVHPAHDQPAKVTTVLEEWTTTRRELWCFYLYFVVRGLLYSLCFSLSRSPTFFFFFFFFPFWRCSLSNAARGAI